MLVLDKVRPENDTLSTHLLVSSAVARLESLGLLESLHATGAPRIRRFEVEFGETSLDIPIKGAIDYALSVRRSKLDPILVEAAQRAGAVVRHEISVQDVVWEDGRVCGIVMRNKAASCVERGRLVIGADGRHSTIARKVHADEYSVLQCPTGLFYAYFSGIQPSMAGAHSVQFASGPGCDVICAPCDGSLHVVLLVIDRDEFELMSKGGSESYMARLHMIPTFAPRLMGARQVGRLYPASPAELRGFFRKPFGPGWALVGDAGYYAHPAAANGISDALRGAEILHQLVEKAWSENREAEAHLMEYQRTRDTENTAPYRYSYRLGKVNPFQDPGLAAFVGGLSVSSARRSQE